MRADSLPAASPAGEAVVVTTRSVNGFAASAIDRLPELIAGAVVFVMFIVLAHCAHWLILRATRWRHRVNVGMVAARVAYFGLVVIGALIALTVVAPSMTPARLVSMLGLGGVAIGFAFKEIFQNMLAGILLLWHEPFRIGDEISSRSFTGVVETIDSRATLIRTYDGKRVIVPNSQIYTEAVAVITAYDRLRTEYEIGIGYGSDIPKAKKVLADILARTEGVLAEPPADVLVAELGGSTVNLRARWWTAPDRATVLAVRDRVLEQLRDRLAAADIEIPFPTNVVLLQDGTDRMSLSPHPREQRGGGSPDIAAPASKNDAKLP